MVVLVVVYDEKYFNLFFQNIVDSLYRIVYIDNVQNECTTNLPIQLGDNMFKEEQLVALIQYNSVLAIGEYAEMKQLIR